MSRELESFINYLKVIKLLSKNSIDSYRSDLLALEQSSNKSLIEIDSMELFSNLSHIDNKRTLNRKLSAFNSFLSYCHKNEIENSAKKIKLSKVPKTLPDFLEHSFIMDSLSLIDRSGWLGMRDYALILFLYGSGLRVSECINLEEVDFEDGWIRVRHSKGSKERYIPLSPAILKSIRDYQSVSPFNNKSHIWLNYTGRPLSRISVFKITQKYLNASPHSLRHSYATSMIVGGADLRVVQELLGHSSLLTTQIYTHIQKRHLADTIEKHHPLAR